MPPFSFVGARGARARGALVSCVLRPLQILERISALTEMEVATWMHCTSMPRCSASCPTCVCVCVCARVLSLARLLIRAIFPSPFLFLLLSFTPPFLPPRFCSRARAAMYARARGTNTQASCCATRQQSTKRAGCFCHTLQPVSSSLAWAARMQGASRARLTCCLAMCSKACCL